MNLTPLLAIYLLTWAAQSFVSRRCGLRQSDRVAGCADALQSAAMSELSGRVAVVTGGGSGIGRAVAQRLIDEGMDVLNADVAAPADAPGSALAARPDHARGQPDGCRGGARALRPARRGRRRTPASSTSRRCREFDEDRWETMISLLLTSPFLLAKYAWDALTEHGDGRFIAIASAHGLVASPFKAAYVSAKHGRSRPGQDARPGGRRRRRAGDRCLPRLCAHAAGRGSDRGAGHGARAQRGARARGRDPRAAADQAADRAVRGGRTWSRSWPVPAGGRSAASR